MNQRHELNKVVLGCLTHHLDDLVARSWADEEVPAEVTEAVEWAKELCKLEEWQMLIARASELACGKDDRGAWTGEHLPLISLFSSISLIGKSSWKVGWFPLEPLKETPIFPLTYDVSDVPPLTRQQYRDLCSKLFNELRELIQKEALFPGTATLLMQKYTSYMPHEKIKPGNGSNHPLPDISLYDHLKQTAAFGTCLYTFAKTRNSSLENVQWDDLEGDYLFVAGDFSGVQEFIYTISSRGALKTLRARSFFLELLTLHAVNEIVEMCELSPLNVLYAGGGRFSVLAPATGRINRTLGDIRRGINEYLANVHDERLYLAMEWGALREDDFCAESPSFERKMRGLYPQVEIAKRRRFRDTFLGSREGRTTFLEPFSPTCPKPEMIPDEPIVKRCVRCPQENVTAAHLDVDIQNRLGKISHRIHGCVHCLDTSRWDEWNDRETKGECRVCHAESAFLIDLPEPSRAEVESKKEPVLACPFCHDLYHLGEHLPGSAFVVRKTGERTYEESRAAVFIERYWYCIKHELDPADQKGNARIWMLNEIEPLRFVETVADPQALQNAWPLMVANHQPYLFQDGHRRPLDFDELAGRATGTDKIGVLQMDVDDLGDVFAEVLRRNLYGSAYFVRAGGLSRQLELFFKFYINSFCLGHGLPEHPLSFSGFEPAPKRPRNWREDKEWGLKGRSVVAVYSGGDDLFMVGAWSDVVELAFDIHRAFKAYTAQNTEIDISGGLILTPKNYPLYHMADLSKQALEKVAKRHKESIGEDDKKKASIALFYTPYEKNSGRCHIRKAIKWTQYDNLSNWITTEEVLKLMRLFSDLRERDDVKEAKAWQLKVSRSFLYDLFSIVQVYREKGKLYLPRLHYILASQRLSTNDEESIKRWEQLKAALMQLDTIEYLPFVITWVDWLCREKAGD